LQTPPTRPSKRPSSYGLRSDGKTPLEERQGILRLGKPVLALDREYKKTRLNPCVSSSMLFSLPFSVKHISGGIESRTTTVGKLCFQTITDVRLPNLREPNRHKLTRERNHVCNLASNYMYSGCDKGVQETFPTQSSQESAIFSNCLWAVLSSPEASSVGQQSFQCFQVLCTRQQFQASEI
jgi:hypothetical protein